MGNVYEDYTFYAVEGGKLRTAVDQWRSERLEAFAASKAFADEVGADGVVSNSRVCGVLCRDQRSLPNWKAARDKTSDGLVYLVPDRRTKAGRDLAKRLNALKVCGAERLSILAIGASNIFTGDLHFSGRGIALRNCFLEVFSGVDVVAVPNISEDGKTRAYAEPDGGLKLKLSEYFAMKESDTAAKGDAA